MKYRGNFDIDACERQFERKSGREARKLGNAKLDREESTILNKAFLGKTRIAGRARGHVRKPRPWQEERDRD